MGWFTCSLHRHTLTTCPQMIECHDCSDVRHRAEAAAVEVGLQARHLNGGLQNGEVLRAGWTRGWRCKGRQKRRRHRMSVKRSSHSIMPSVQDCLKRSVPAAQRVLMVANAHSGSENHSPSAYAPGQRRRERRWMGNSPFNPSRPIAIGGLTSLYAPRRCESGRAPGLCGGGFAAPVSN